MWILNRLASSEASWSGSRVFLKLDISKFSRTRVNHNGDILSTHYLLYHLLIITYTNSLDPESEVIKHFSCSRQLSIKFIMVINVKMPTIVSILTFISMINTAIKSLKARKVIIFQHSSFYEQSKFRAQLSWAWKRFYNRKVFLKKVNFWKNKSQETVTKIKNYC